MSLVRDVGNMKPVRVVGWLLCLAAIVYYLVTVVTTAAMLVTVMSFPEGCVTVVDNDGYDIKIDESKLREGATPSTQGDFSLYGRASDVDRFLAMLSFSTGGVFGSAELRIYDGDRAEIDDYTYTTFGFNQHSSFDLSSLATPLGFLLLTKALSLAAVCFLGCSFRVLWRSKSTSKKALIKWTKLYSASLALCALVEMVYEVLHSSLVATTPYTLTLGVGFDWILLVSAVVMLLLFCSTYTSTNAAIPKEED